MMRSLTNLCPEDMDCVDAALLRELNTLPSPLYPVAAHIASLPGKRLRPLLCLTVARALGAEGPSVYPLAAALEILHCATLLHDDVLDRANTRRDVLAAHLKFGESLAILAGDAMFALSGGIIARYKNPRLMIIFSAAIQRAAGGQALEFSRLFDPNVGTTQYLEIIAGKTAALFEAAALCGAEFAAASPKMSAGAAVFAFNFGLAFQLMDDLADFFPTPRSGKPFAADTLEGKLTAPILAWLVASSSSEREEFLDKFSQKKLTPGDITSFSDKLLQKKVPECIRSKANFFCLQANLGLQVLPSNCYKGILEKIINSYSNRD